MARHPDGGQLGRLLRATTHRSPAGLAREVVLAGVPACRRCSALTGGALAGMVVALAVAPAPLVVAVVAGPAVVDALREKWWGRAHRPGLLLAANLAAGGAFGRPSSASSGAPGSSWRAPQWCSPAWWCGPRRGPAAASGPW